MILVTAACRVPVYPKRAAGRAISRILLQSAINIQGRPAAASRLPIAIPKKPAPTDWTSVPPAPKLHICSKRVATPKPEAFIARCSVGLNAADATARPFPSS